jgi:hypothetical protein
MKNLTTFFRLLALVVVFVSATVKAQYTGSGNHVITIDQAAKFVQNFKQNPTAPTIKGGYFDRNIFDKILAQGGVVGIRYYYAAKDDGTPTIVLVGVDSTGNDMVQGVVGEWGVPCPPNCGSTNQLNK